MIPFWNAWERAGFIALVVVTIAATVATVWLSAGC